MWHGKRKLRNVPGQRESCRRRIEQTAPDHRGCKMPNPHDVVHIDREVLHGGFPPPRCMEGFRKLRRSSKHFKEGRVKEVACKTSRGSITGFSCYLAAGLRCCGWVHLASWTTKRSSPGAVAGMLPVPVSAVHWPWLSRIRALVLSESSDRTHCRSVVELAACGQGPFGAQGRWWQR